jgi:hypothetical protein
VTGEPTLLDGWSAALGKGWGERCLASTSLALGADRDEAAAHDWDDAQRELLRFSASRTGRVDAVATCPHCAAMIDVDVPVARMALASSSSDDVTPLAARRVGRVHAALRVPTVGDLIDAAALDTPEEAQALLAERCGLGEVDPEEWDAAITDLDESHPLLAASCAVACPDCGEEFEATLDPVELCWEAVDAAATEVIDDVVALATAFGWSEADVLAVPPRRRAMYRRLAGAGAP